MCAISQPMEPELSSPASGGTAMLSHETAQFDGLARHYDWLETVLAGDKLVKCRNLFLDQINHPKSVLTAGEGHGKFLAEIVRHFPQASVTCLDASASMLAVARKCLKDQNLPTERVTFIHGDLLNSPLGSHDLIGTHFFLDCLTPVQLEAAIKKLAASLEPGGFWMLSDFQLPERGWRRWRARAIHWAMYRFFRAVTRLPASKITKPAPLLQESGLICECRREFDWGLLHAELWRKPY